MGGQPPASEVGGRGGGAASQTRESATTPRLTLLAFRDVVISPYTELLAPLRGGEYHQGGPHWPDWPAQKAARHCNGGRPNDTEPLEVEPVSTLAGSLAWGGAVTWHFGHEIADFTTRLMPTLAEIPDARFAFSSLAKYPFRSLEMTPAFFRSILDWYGIDHDRVEMIAEPTLVERLVVAPQAEQFPHPGPDPWYLDLLDEHFAGRMGEVSKEGSLYVSRAGQPARFAGEGYLESALRGIGFRVLRPETVSLEEQLRAYASAESIIFADGSAIHGVQLMGRALGDVMVLFRRRGSAALTLPVLEPRSQSVRYVDAVRGLVHDRDIGGHPADYYGLAILDPEKLLNVLPISDAWEPAAFEAAQEADLAEWLERERESPRWEVPGSPELVAESLREAGLSHP